MKYNVLQYLEETAAKYPEKAAFRDDNNSLTFGQLLENARSVGSHLCKHTKSGRPVAVLMDKSPFCIAAFLGIAYAGCTYVPLDTAMPTERLTAILDILRPDCMISGRMNLTAANTLIENIRIISFDEAVSAEIDDTALSSVRSRMLNGDPLYILFTSGSTGVPKGVTVSHRSVIDHIEWAAGALRIDETAVFGNQVPFYFDMSVLDIYMTLRQGAETFLLPKKCFLFPKTLMEYLNREKINTVYWVPFVLVNTANSGILETNPPEYLRRVYFAGDVMPAKQLNAWKRLLPGACYCNLFGPTETTNVFTYYFSDTNLADDIPVPIGKACGNTRILLLDENNREAVIGEIGEMCVVGDCVALGYYNNKEKTKLAFVQNPLNPYYPETMYKTGDLAYYDSNGNLIFAGRKDSQIKHQGYRIELGDIETAVGAIDGVTFGCCLYDSGKDRIFCFYTGTLSGKELISLIKDKIPGYMIPGEFVRLAEMPLNSNGKIDRIRLKIDYFGV